MVARLRVALDVKVASIASGSAVTVSNLQLRPRVVHQPLFAHVHSHSPELHANKRLQDGKDSAHRHRSEGREGKIGKQHESREGNVHHEPLASRTSDTRILAPYKVLPSSDFHYC